MYIYNVLYVCACALSTQHTILILLYYICEDWGQFWKEVKEKEKGISLYKSAHIIFNVPLISLYHDFSLHVYRHMVCSQDEEQRLPHNT